MNQVIDNNQRWVSFLNASGGEIPPYAVISFKSDKGASSDVANYSQRLVAKKFSDGDPCAATAFNSGAKVPDGKYGVCTFPVNGPCWARVDYGAAKTQFNDYVEDMCNMSETGLLGRVRRAGGNKMEFTWRRK